VGVPFTIGPPAVASLQQVHDNPVLWLGVLGALVLLAVRKRAGKVQSPVLSTMVVWLGVNTVGLVVLFRGFLYQHYFQPLVPPAVVLAAWLFVALGEKLGRRLNLRVSPNAMFLAAVVLIPLVGAAGPLTLGAKHLYFLTIKHRQHWLDPEVEIADRIRPELKAGDTIYVVDGSPILYFLTDAELPTRYVFPPFLIKRVDMPDIMNVVPDEELSHIFAKRPRFVIKRHVDADPYYRPQAYQYLARVRECLSKGYQLKFSVDRDEVYELIDGQRSTCAS